MDDKSKVESIFQNILNEIFGKDSVKPTMKNPLIFSNFMEFDFNEDEEVTNQESTTGNYREVACFEDLQVKLQEILDSYNSQNSGQDMNLVLFNDAMDHLVRLMRILSFPKGHALLVGYGGSGKKSLTHLSTFISQYELFQIKMKRNYKEINFKEDLLELFTEILGSKEVGAKLNKQIVFMFTDAQIMEESFLETVNTILTVGIVNNLFDDSSKNDIRNNFRKKSKEKGRGEQPEEVWEFFADYVRQNLHMVLCMSPAGQSLRIRCRNFPGLVSSTNIDWFYSWPEEALKDVAVHYMNDFKLGFPEKLELAIIDHFVHVHLEMPLISLQYKKKAGRTNFSTPKNYLDFLKNFQKVFEENQNQSKLNIERFTLGLEKLAEGAQKIGILKVEISKDSEVVAKKTQEVSDLLKQINTKSKIAEEKQKIATEKSAQLEIENVEIQKNEEEADTILKAKEPELLLAQQKVAEIQKKNLDYIKNLKNPPLLIELTVKCLQILKVSSNTSDDSWSGALLMLGDNKLINNLIDFARPEGRIKGVKQSQITKVQKIINNINDELTTKKKTMDQVSPACTKLKCWVEAVLGLYETNNRIKPLKEKVAMLKQKKAIKQRELKETKETLKKLNEELKILNTAKNQKEGELNILSTKLKNMQDKLAKAEKLITDLTSEKVRWGKEKDHLFEQKKYLCGNSLICSSFLSYFGPFDQTFRKSMFKDFMKDVKEREILFEKNFRVEGTLTSEVEIATWNSQSLPNDELSVQNGILTIRASRYPLCIDPQLQALNWLRSKFAHMKLEVTSFADEKQFGRSLELCVRFNHPLLIENVQEELDPLIDSILEKSYTIQGGSTYISLGGELIKFDENEFTLVMVSKMSNPHYSPEVMGKTSVINYSVTFEGLKEQLISEVVKHEQEEKEKQRKELINEMSDKQRKRKKLEDDLLTGLVNAKGSLLDEVELIATLENTKHQSAEIEKRIIEAAETRKVLEQARQSYQNVAIRGAILFFCMQKLSAISQMYEYSLSSYLDVFRLSLHEAKQENILLHRINNIIDKLTQNMYDYTLLGIFETHKLMFSFQMTIMIMDQAGKMNNQELDFFLKGNTSLEENTVKKPVKWLGDSNFKDFVFLSSLSDLWRPLLESLKENKQEWFKWFSLMTPEDNPAPDPFHEISKFQKLLLLKIFRPDRVINGIKRFIIEQYRDNEHYVQSPTINFKKILKQSNEKSPILFILSPGADPLHDVQELANIEGFTGNKFKSISLGQNMENEAEELILNFAQRGNWAMLQNCDLLPNWLQNLEKLLEYLFKSNSKIKVNKNFRLWLTTKPTKAFPLGILQNSLKVVTEPPEGLKLNMRAIASKLGEEDLQICNHESFKPLSYVIIYFHAILLDRRKFGKIGFNVCYDFNESDFRISFQLLRLYLDKSIQNKDDSIPWESLKYLIGEAMYGGRVTDDYDRRILITYLDEYMGDFLFDDNNEFSFAKTDNFDYTLPKFTNIELLNSKINELPIIDHPYVFGLNPNSEITYFSNSAKAIWSNLLSMQLVGNSQLSALENSNQIIKISNDLLEKTPEPFDIAKIFFEIGKNFTPTLIVLVQELERFNKLIIAIQQTLKNLARALKGEIGMNSQLEDLSTCLLNGLLPNSWRKLAPATQKNLSNWILHFKKRVEQYQIWINQRSLKAIWLSGLHIPESFLTALVQATCRKKNWALDKSTLFTCITEFYEESEIEELEFGCYIKGLYLEGASWDIENNCITTQKPKQLITELPFMKINPVEINKLKLKDTLKVPVYVTQNRRNAAGSGLVFHADFRTTEHSSHWILQGIAVVLNTDN